MDDDQAMTIKPIYGHGCLYYVVCVLYRVVNKLNYTSLNDVGESGMVLILMLIFMLVISIAALVYWVKSLIVMSNNTPFLACGILFSPFAQIAYFFSKRDEMDDDQATTMKRFFMVMVAYCIGAVIVGFYIS